MTKFRITYSASQQIVGDFEADNQQDAIEAYARNAGAPSYAYLATTIGLDPDDTSDLIVTEIDQLQQAIEAALETFRDEYPDAETVALNVNRDHGVWDVNLNGDYNYTVIETEIDATRSDADLVKEMHASILGCWEVEWDEEYVSEDDQDDRDDSNRNRAHADYDYGNTSIDA